ncbi:hypothetical protein QN224_24770 [Sinorhizobium sp. 8-89]|uniref:hypothetical protein n=1 Tax=Sinorhizobium sp. 7-81 TaxID=3049087 RepID=UPI0024C2B0D0|nr:hypothetical protein [Sinorhizobium sp. 7-81]MDK1388627.1 hypothetical protein [Sinorhizobium sp. 7-81]
MKRSRWYGIRVAPGYQRMAAADDRLPESRRILRLVSRVAQPGACNERDGC